jgi:hypothetical protein
MKIVAKRAADKFPSRCDDRKGVAAETSRLESSHVFATCLNEGIQVLLRHNSDVRLGSIRSQEALVVEKVGYSLHVRNVAHGLAERKHYQYGLPYSAVHCARFSPLRALLGHAR